MVKVLDAGVKGYVLSSEVSAGLMSGIHEVTRGNTYLSPGISRDLVQALRAGPTPAKDPLTFRER